MKLGAQSAPAPADTPDAAPAPAVDPADDSQDNLFGGDNAATPTDAPSNDKPFDDEPFNAGVEADEESDPKKFIEQLTGKLGQSLRKYEEEQGSPDFELEKFAINSLLSATHTAEMNPEDQKDIIKKVKSSGKGDENAEMATDDSEETPTEEPVNAPEDTPQDTPEDDENLFETLDEMSLNDWRTKAIINMYDSGDNDMKLLLTKLVSFTKEIDREEFIDDLRHGGVDDVKYVFSKLEELGVKIPVEDTSFDLNEVQIFLNNPPKNNMFQEGSNDILDEKAPCWKGYKQVGMKTKNGKEVPNCVPIDENILRLHNNLINKIRK